VYDAPLTEKQMADYELRAAPGNPDRKAPCGNREKVNPLPPDWQREQNRWNGKTPPGLPPKKAQRKTGKHFGPTWPEVTKRRFF